MQWRKKVVQNWKDYLSYQDTFVYSKIIFLWSDSKNWGPALPFLSLML